MTIRVLIAGDDTGFVLKDDPPEQLIAAVHTVAAGDALLSPAITKRVIRQFTGIPRPAPPNELDELTTVKTHVTHILAKLRDRVQAVAVAEPGRARARAAEWTDIFRRLR
jgi:DNA-binding NarL/FixJ family response regulator